AVRPGSRPAARTAPAGRPSLTALPAAPRSQATGPRARNGPTRRMEASTPRSRPEHTAVTTPLSAVDAAFVSLERIAVWRASAMERRTGGAESPPAPAAPP